MTKTLSTLRIEGKFLNLIENIYKTNLVNIILNSKKLEAFLLRLGTRQGCPLSHLFKIVLQVLANTIRPKRGGKKGKKNLNVHIGKKEI